MSREGPATGHRQVGLPDGRTLTVRPVVPEDAEGLAALYHSLPPEDERRRFFSAYRVRRQNLDEWTHPEAHGAYRLVAVVADGDARIVGEAGYNVLANGDGEFAIAVAADWRGWLGPYLLDALVDAAAARGIPNLEADILLENRPMLGLVRARGYATLGHENYSVVRVIIGTGCRVPGWPGSHHRPRVLVEGSGGRWPAEAAAEQAGLQVVVCPGPGERPGGRCPALAGEPCPLAQGADVIVFALRADDPHAHEILDAHRRVHPDVPVWAPTRAAEPDELVSGVLEALGAAPPATADGAG